MSLSAIKSPLIVRNRASFDNLAESLFEQGFEWKHGHLIEIGVDERSLSTSEILRISSSSFTEDELKNLIENKSRGAVYIAWRIWRNDSASISSMCSDWAALKSVRRWMAQQDRDSLKQMDLVTSYKQSQTQLGLEAIPRFQPQKLLALGIRFGWQAERFCRLYKEICNQKRPWGSCFQPNHELVKRVALTPNFNRLPLWVKRVLIQSGNVQTERIGNVWQLLPAAKAWKYAPDLPKAIAVRIGKMPVWKRLIAAKIWKSLCYSSLDYERRNQDGWEFSTTRTTLTNKFWLEFNKQSSYNPVALLDEIVTEHGEKSDTRYASRLAESVLALPHGYLGGTFDKSKLTDYYRLADKDALLKELFGTNAKSVKAAWDSCKPNQMRWAIALAPKENADVVCKFLNAPCVVNYEEGTVEFLKSLGDWKPQLRMLTTTTYRVRGEEKLVEDFLVKDTGMLFNNLVNQGNTPDLGRVRCWLTTHEELGRKYIGTLPNGPVNVPSEWKQVDGLCSVKGEWSISLPSSTGQLKYWGEQLHNCVGGYGNSINSGDCVVFVVHVDGILTYCVEIVHRWARQFMGCRNSPVDNEVSHSVIAALQQAELLN